MASMGRQAVAFGFLTSTEYRTDQVTDYYSTLLHRAPDSAGLSSAVNSGLDLRSIFINFESSSEFFANGG